MLVSVPIADYQGTIVLSNLVDYLQTQRKVERYLETFVSRERVASFLNFVPDLEVTRYHVYRTVLVFQSCIYFMKKSSTIVTITL